MTKRARGHEFPEPDEHPESDIDWDEVVDIICVGTEPGPVAQAVSGVQCGRQVLALARPQSWDPETDAYIAEMTADLSPAESTSPLQVTRARPVIAEPARGRLIDTFVGAHLHDWAAQCQATSFGVLYTDVLGVDTTRMHTDDGRQIDVVLLGTYPSDADRSGRAVSEWLSAQARECRVNPDPDVSLRRLITEFGRVAGAELATDSGPLLVRALDGVALPAASSDTDCALHSELGDADFDVAIVRLPAARFGRVELLITD